MEDGKKGKVLIVDDEPVNVKLLEAYLLNEYDIITAFGGMEALAKVEEHNPDIILLDIMMPDITGYKVCEMLKSSEDTRFIPIVMVTALSGTEDRIIGIRAGADDFLTKPLDRIELNTRVSSLLRIKQLHDDLINQRDQANLYLDLAAVVLLVLDEAGNVRLMSKKGYELLGYTEEEITGTDWFDNYIPASARQAFRDLFGKSLSGESDHESYFESPVLNRNGEERIISWNNIVPMVSNGHVNSVLISGTDVTERKKAEEKIRRANEYLDNLLKASPIAMLSLDSNRNILTVNNNATNLLGRELNNLVGRPVSSIMDGKDHLDFRDVKDIEFVFIKGTGEKIPMNVSTSVVAGNGDENNLVITMQDRSELRGLFITPLTEDVHEDVMENGSELEPGFMYLVDCSEKGDAYSVFSYLVKQGKPGLCITRNNPENIRVKYGLSRTPFLWLSKNKNRSQQTMDPAELFRIHPTISDFINKVNDGAILMDGLEYLLLDNDFISVIKLIEQVNDTIMASDSRLILMVDPGTLDKKQFHMLKRWMRLLKKGFVSGDGKQSLN
ncbi:hypothetical protein CUN85_04510 [Methanolobus halotolerans]|uniref:PAS domain S-box-containing protein n=2 Tax=Methanolobus halotolerans TaxID=2052935 RepID=A0A4E0Q7G1_9EURY|nr:hypothetical protein CUN85_04510 [Methanolobus halotolerans]